MTWLDKIRFWKRKAKSEPKVKARWLQHSNTSKPRWEFHKIRVPGLRTAKRVIAAFLFIINFFIAQSALTSALATQPLYWLFGFNALILLDYLWKTRRKTS